MSGCWICLSGFGFVVGIVGAVVVKIFVGFVVGIGVGFGFVVGIVGAVVVVEQLQLTRYLSELLQSMR